jgi:D-glycero-D-manno-heptose 1,7-bisphosphate phosphatase
MRAVLLDRDGVINELVYHEEAGIIDGPFTPSQFRLLPRVPQAIRSLNALGLRVVVVSNQPGIAKGHLRRETLKQFERTMISRVEAGGGHIDGIYYCLHHPKARVRALRRRCRCRKPGIGLLQRAAKHLNVSLEECYLVGDGIPDLLAGTRAKCRTIFIGRWKCQICQFTEAPTVRPIFVAENLWEACQFIRSEVKGEPLQDSPNHSRPCLKMLKSGNVRTAWKQSDPRPSFQQV